MGIDEQIRRLIKKRDISGYAVAKAIGVNVSVIYRYLDGADISAATLAKIVDYLELSLGPKK